MTDAIEELIQNMKNRRKSHAKKKQESMDSYQDQYCHGRIDECDYVIRELANLTSAPSRPVESDAVWISVKDRYPTPNDNDKPVYLAFHPIQWGGDYEITQAGFTSADAGIWPVVTHWMPLPQPPIQTP